VVFDEMVAQYYQDVFLHDWEKRAFFSTKDDSVSTDEPDTESSIIEDGLTEVDWSEYFS